MVDIITFDCVDHNKLWKVPQEMEIPHHVTCLLRHLYAGQEATIRTGHGTTDWFQIGKEYIKGIYCQPAYLTYMQSKYIMQNAGLDEAQAEIKIARRSINNFRYTGDIPLYGRK